MNIPKWLWNNAIAGKLDHLRKIDNGYVADPYFLDVQWFIEFVSIADKKGYEITVNGLSRYLSTCIEIKITKKEDDNLS